MNDDRRDQPHDDAYLWDGTGVPDRDVVGLEKTLAVLRHRGTLPELPDRPAAPATPSSSRFRWLAAAAALLILAGGAWLVVMLRTTTWSVNSVAGTPEIGERAVLTQSALKQGEWLVTDNRSRARIAVGGIGNVDVEPNTRLQMVAAGREHRMALDRGTIHARIWAPPKLFFVYTQAAVAVDLGCAYTLQIDEKGAGQLRVTSGWVGLERAGRDTYIPEGAVCAMRSDIGPGTPRYEDSPSGYGEALAILDFSRPDDPRRPAALALVLSTARRRDGMTLWHLLTRGTPAERAQVYDRLAALVPPPQGVTRAEILRGDRGALNQWWDQLGVDATSWWRLFKKKF
jgi:ferric-dicitrate binding protein FerR (iron transport regulator)